MPIPGHDEERAEEDQRRGMRKMRNAGRHESQARDPDYFRSVLLQIKTTSGEPS